MKIYTNEYTQKVYEILEPLIGDMMARGTIKTQTSGIGIDEKNLMPQDLQKLSEGIQRGLTIFVGSDTAKKIATKISMIN
jgi:hypothetical protein